MKKNILSYICLVILSLLVINCNPIEKDEIKLVITCDGTFSGDYHINGEYASIDNITETDTGYYYEMTFDDLNILEVYVKRSACNQTLRIGIYRNNDRVGHDSLPAVSGETCTTNILEFTYEYDEENSQTDSTSA